MKAIFSSFFLLFFIIIGRAQLFNIDNLIDSDIGFAKVNTGDFNNDGYPDLISITSQRLVWYKNLDGLGNFSEPIEIDNGRGSSLSQLVVDLDKDGWEDILISYFDQDFIAYYRNLGNESFAPLQVLASNLNSCRGIAAGDLDDDGDLDLVLGVTNNVGFYWKEHLDGNGGFGPLQLINNTISQARTQVLGDIDGDGDLDIVTNGLNPLMSWFENINGQGDFLEYHIIDNSGDLYENFFQIIDIDGDGDLDNISNKLDEILWRENIDGQGSFGAKQIIFSYSDNTPDLGGIQAVDLDIDGDIDITYNSGVDFGKVYHFNLDGLGTFGPPNFIAPPEGGSSGNNLPIDIDSDGDMDLINTSLNLTTQIEDLYWYENLTNLNISDVEALGIKIYPNPVKEVLVIESPIPIQKVRVYSVIGNLLLEIIEKTHEIPINHFPNGLLLIEVHTEKGKMIEKVVKE
ncbi:MAG: T9SS type A sorting domain-containing protein [Flavobacteriaceae bacterium]